MVFPTFFYLSLTMLLVVGFSYIVFIIVSQFPSVSSSLSLFIVKRCEILSNSFIASTEIIFFSFLHSIKVNITLINFCLLTHS